MTIIRTLLLIPLVGILCLLASFKFPGLTEFMLGIFIIYTPLIIYNAWVQWREHERNPHH